jgi:hypothetical protein
MTEYVMPDKLATAEHLGIKVAWIGEDGDAIAFTDDLETGKAAILELGRVDLGTECGIAADIKLRWLRFEIPEGHAADEWRGEWCKEDDEGAVRIVYAGEVTERANLGGAVIDVCFCPDFRDPQAPPVGHRPGSRGCRNAPEAPESLLADDPLRETETGDPDPFEGEEADSPCGAETKVGPNSWNKVVCDRDAHPARWLHIAVVDDRVEHVWRDIAPEELPLLVVTDGEGVVFGCCGWVLTADGEHTSNCPVGGSDREPEGTTGG